MSAHGMSFEEWYAEFKRVAEQFGLPVNDDPEAYRDFYTDGTTPDEAVDTELMSID